jgi:hypothetical protein
MPDYKWLVDKYRASLKDREPLDFPEKEYNILQIKYDGWWVIIPVKDGMATVVTSGGAIKETFKTTMEDCVLIAEYIYGTNWAQSSSLKGKFLVHDCVGYRELDFSKLHYSLRYGYAEVIIAGQPRFKMVENLDPRAAHDLWKTEVETRNVEGLVFKRSDDIGNAWLRMKMEVTQDYICMEFEEGKGRLAGTLGAIVGGLMIPGNSEIQKVCTVGGGFSDELRHEIWNNKIRYYMEVFEAKGKTQFPSGALRHPNFVRFRLDVGYESCKYSG